MTIDKVSVYAFSTVYACESLRTQSATFENMIKQLYLKSDNCYKPSVTPSDVQECL